jgi:hypothetical protein
MSGGPYMALSPDHAEVFHDIETVAAEAPEINVVQSTLNSYLTGGGLNVKLSGTNKQPKGCLTASMQEIARYARERMRA